MGDRPPGPKRPHPGSAGGSAALVTVLSLKMSRCVRRTQRAGVAACACRPHPTTEPCGCARHQRGSVARPRCNPCCIVPGCEAFGLTDEPVSPTLVQLRHPAARGHMDGTRARRARLVGGLAAGLLLVGVGGLSGSAAQPRLTAARRRAREPCAWRPKRRRTRSTRRRWGATAASSWRKTSSAA